MQLAQPTIGPILGARVYEERSVQQHITVRGKDEWSDQTCVIKLESDDGRETRLFRIPISKHARNDRIGKLVLKGLSFDTNYKYRIGILQGKHTITELRHAKFKNGVTGTFITRNPRASVTRFVFGSCCHRSLIGINQADDAAFKTMCEQWVGDEHVRDDFIMMLGDQIYGDHYNKRGLLATMPILQKYKHKLNLEHYLDHYRTAFSKRYKRKVMASIPAYMIFDDHEVHNDWGTEKFLRDTTDYRILQDALHAYGLYQVSHPEVKPADLKRIAFGKTLPKAKYYYEFSHGKGDFFVMDTRYEKIPQGQMVSTVQMTALKAFLDRGHDRVKFIVSSVPMLPDAQLSKFNQILDSSPHDRWEGHIAQRNEILEHIKSNAKRAINPNVVVLSGDVHVSYAFKLTSSKEKRFQLHQITSSAFNWGVGLQDRNFAKATPLTGTDREYKPKDLLDKVILADNFCRVCIKSDKIDVRFYRAKSGRLCGRTIIDLIKPVNPA